MYCISAYSSFIVLGSYTTRCDFSQGPCDWTQSTEDDFNWSRRRGEYYDIIIYLLLGKKQELAIAK